jgi:hypothetical protein
MRSPFLLLALLLTTTDSTLGAQDAQSRQTVERRLREIMKSAQSELLPLLKSAVWSGDRLRVVGVKEGFPVTESVGPWRIELAPHPEKNLIDLKGLKFAGKHKLRVQLDLDNDSLLIGGKLFEGRKISGKSPIARSAAFKGLAFERDGADIEGKASIIFLEDGRTVMDFHKIYIGDAKAGEYGTLSQGK